MTSVGFASVAERVVAYVVGFGLLGAVAAPAFGEPGDDSFPFSTYPMFARPKTKTVVAFAEGLERGGRPVRLAPELVANDEAMQVAHTVRRAIRGGPERKAALCQRISQRVARTAALDAIVSVRLVLGRFDSVGYFLGASEPEARTIEHECAVPRPE